MTPQERLEMEALLEGQHHPYSEQHANQLQALWDIPKDNRSWLAYMLRTGNVNFRYYHQDIGDITSEDEQEYLEGLPPQLQRSLASSSLGDMAKSLGVRRHALERRGMGMSEFMKEHLSEADWNQWKTNIH